jgi:UDP-N-acetylmuramoyl-L-alanyl-D-glutamate--2,6-diaminopimelate ligase
MKAVDALGAVEGMRLDELAREVPGGASIVGDGSVRVVGVHHDSRAVQRGDLFVARKGERADGAAFVPDAIARGAVALMAARGGARAAVPAIEVDDVQAGLAYAAAAVYGHPAFSLEVVGVTGTNGKTTATHLIRAAIDGAIGAGAYCGTIGTVGHRFGDLAIDAEHTTPEADEIARVMAAMRKRGATHVAMEVSSHALAQRRVRAVRFRVAAFTNLTQDHLDFHRTMDEYAAAKALLFTEMSPGAAVINVDDPFGETLVSLVEAPLVRVSAKVGASDDDAEIAPRAVTMSADGIDATLRTPVGDVRVRSRLVGAHNLENLVVTLGVVHALELDLARAADALGRESGAPGRLERCDAPGDDVTVLVDYAHTPDALARALESVRAFAKGRIWCVFGCGGDRDATKRAPMGAAAARGADALVVTNDNPRTEDPAAIARAICVGVRGAGVDEAGVAALGSGARGFVVELDRARAIALAIGAASANDVVVIAGKGHEDYQIVGVEKRHFDDREEARRALAVRRATLGTARES